MRNGWNVIWIWRVGLSSSTLLKVTIRRKKEKRVWVRVRVRVSLTLVWKDKTKG